MTCGLGCRNIAHVRLEHLTCWTWKAAPFGEGAAFLLSTSRLADWFLCHRHLPKGSVALSSRRPRLRVGTDLGVDKYLGAIQKNPQRCGYAATSSAQPAVGATDRKVIQARIVSRAPNSEACIRIASRSLVARQRLGLTEALNREGVRIQSESALPMSNTLIIYGSVQFSVLLRIGREISTKHREDFLFRPCR